jgi:hypothetical protein
LGCAAAVDVVNTVPQISTQDSDIARNSLAVAERELLALV